MKDERVKHALEFIARRGVPESIDLWPEIESRLEKDTLSMKPMKLTWSLALTILALILVTTVAYALYRYFTDPGLQAAQDAGLITDVNSTAQPTVLPAATPIDVESAMQVGDAQTFEDVTLTLDWIYLEDSQQAFHISATGLAPDMRLGMPVVTYVDVTPEQYRGALFSIDESQPLSGTYVSYQLVRKNGQFGGNVDVRINIPLLRREAGQSTQIANIQFDVMAVPVIVPMGGGGGNAYAVRVNGLQMELVHAIVTPDYTEARLCYQVPSMDKDWAIRDATVQFAGRAGLVAEPVSMDGYIQLQDQADERCADVNFPLGKGPGDTYFFVSVNGMVLREDPNEKIDSTWQFGTVLIDDMHVPGVSVTPTPAAPLASETIGDLTATLDWAYTDANRAAFRVHFDGWQESYFINGVSLLDAEGVDINSSIGTQPQEADASRQFFEFEPIDGLTGERFNGQLVLMVSNDPINSTSFAEFRFDLDLPLYPAKVIEVMQRVKVNEVEMLLQKVKITPSFTYVYVCYNKPTSGEFSDWQVAYTGTSLRVGEDEATINTQMFLFDSDLGDVGKGPEYGWKSPITTGRCVKIGFPVGQHDRPESLTFTVPQLDQSLPEVISDAELKRAQEKLEKEGIELEYVTFIGNGGGGGGPVIKKKPEGMTDEEAFQHFIEALGYVYKGPWIFTMDIQP